MRDDGGYRRMIQRRARHAAVLAGWFAAATLVTGPAIRAQNPAGRLNPMDSIGRLPNYRAAYDTAPLLPESRIASLAPARRREWQSYLARSRAMFIRDTLMMRAELAAAHRTTMQRAPYAHDFSVTPAMTPGWFEGDSAQTLAHAILSFQAPDGGWSKHVDFSLGTRQPGESYFAESDVWEWISTIDNDQTTEEMHFLALADRTRHDVRYESAFRRALVYLLDAQYPNGCWPQVYPLQGSYHDAVTFNDDAMINVMRILDETARGNYGFVSGAERDRARSASARGLECIRSAQVVVDGTPLAWAQQNDPLTLAPGPARSYELTSIAGLESAHVADYLMSLAVPTPGTIRAVTAAVAWLRRVTLHDVTYDTAGGLRATPGSGPVWARMYEIGSNRPIFSNRNGIRLYDWNQLTDRRHGYGWYTYAPAATLKTYDVWMRDHPLPTVSQ